MNGAVLVSCDFVPTGGMDMPNLALAEHLAESGVSVELVGYRVAEPLPSHPNVRWHKVPKPLNSYFLGSPLLDLVGRRVAKKALARGERVLVNGGNCQIGDVNWVHYVHAAYRRTSATFLRRAKGELTHRIDVAQEASALRAAKLIIANSERTRRDLTEHLRLDDARIRTVYYGIDPVRFAPPDETRRKQLREKFRWPDRPQVAFVGALGDRRKGFDTLFSAWSNLCKDSTWDCDLVVAGQGAELPAWQERTRAVGIADRIRFLGFRADMPDVLAACDALIAPTRYEAYGLGVHEALCIGLPALVSADAGVAERYPSELQALLLPDPSNVAGIESSLRNWRRNHERFAADTRTLSISLRKRSWQTMAQDIRSLLD